MLVTGAGGTHPADTDALMLGVNDAIETNVFVAGINSIVKARSHGAMCGCVFRITIRVTQNGYTTHSMR